MSPDPTRSGGEDERGTDDKGVDPQLPGWEVVMQKQENGKNIRVYRGPNGEYTESKRQALLLTSGQPYIAAQLASKTKVGHGASATSSPLATQQPAPRAAAAAARARSLELAAGRDDGGERKPRTGPRRNGRKWGGLGDAAAKLTGSAAAEAEQHNPGTSALRNVRSHQPLRPDATPLPPHPSPHTHVPPPLPSRPSLAADSSPAGAAPPPRTTLNPHTASRPLACGSSACILPACTGPPPPSARSYRLSTRLRAADPASRATQAIERAELIRKPDECFVLIQPWEVVTSAQPSPRKAPLPPCPASPAAPSPAVSRPSPGPEPGQAPIGDGSKCGTDDATATEAMKTEGAAMDVYELRPSTNGANGADHAREAGGAAAAGAGGIVKLEAVGTSEPRKEEVAAPTRAGDGEGDIQAKECAPAEAAEAATDMEVDGPEAVAPAVAEQAERRETREIKEPVREVREIEEGCCRRGCGQRFTHAPARVSHEKVCKGIAKDRSADAAKPGGAVTERSRSPGRPAAALLAEEAGPMEVDDLGSSSRQDAAGGTGGGGGGDAHGGGASQLFRKTTKRRHDDIYADKRIRIGSNYQVSALPRHTSSAARASASASDDRQGCLLYSGSSLSVEAVQDYLRLATDQWCPGASATAATAGPSSSADAAAGAGASAGRGVPGRGSKKPAHLLVTTTDTLPLPTSLDASAQEAALEALHHHGYQLPVAAAQLAPSAPVGPAGASAQLSSWSGKEKALFASALLSHGKDFFAIRKHMLPGKSVAELVNYYYARKPSPVRLESDPPRFLSARPVVLHTQRTAAPPAIDAAPAAPPYVSASCAAAGGACVAEAATHVALAFPALKAAPAAGAHSLATPPPPPPALLPARNGPMPPRAAAAAIAEGAAAVAAASAAAAVAAAAGALEGVAGNMEPAVPPDESSRAGG